MRCFGNGYMDIVRAIKYYRKIYHLTQSEVAELSGINEKYLGRIERNESVPTIDKVEQLCQAFDIRITDLLMIRPERLETYSKLMKGSVESENKLHETMYYCNCCGCTFQEECEKRENVLCPVCGCMYDEELDYIERIEM